MNDEHSLNSGEVHDTRTHDKNTQLHSTKLN
jgi:hypothetical protein